MKIYFPDYKSCNAGISAAVYDYYGLDNYIDKIPEVTDLLGHNPRNVLLMLFDGLGIDAMERHLSADSFLRRHFVRTLSSVFPPTTTAATTAVRQSLLPAAHGWLAWALYFPELDCNVELFRNTIHRSGGKPAASYPVAETFMPLPDIVKPLKAAGGLVDAGSISPFGSVPARTFEEVFQKSEALCHEPGRHFYYGYWTGPDDTMHATGVSSVETREAIRQIDRRMAELCAALAGTDTLVLATADHGLIDVRYHLLQDTPEVAAHLRRPLAMESRCVSFAVKSGHEEAFVRDFKEAYGEEFLLLSREEVLQRKLFGPGPEHPRFRQSLGDFLAIAIGEVCLVESPCHESETFRAAHAGLTEQEMLVPLFAIQC